MTTQSDTHSTTYETALLDWRGTMEQSLRGENGWLKLAGLFWLHEGDNTVGSASDADVLLPLHSAPERVGVITLRDGMVHFHGAQGIDTYIDDAPISDAALRDDNDAIGASRVTLGAVRFFVIRRGERLGVRVIDHDHPALKTFIGRQWYPIDPEARTLTVINSVDQEVPMRNPGAVAFALHGQPYRLEAFEGGDGELWFIFKDQTNGTSTYGAGRFLTAPLAADGRVDLDFNRAYSPPCAFTPYATCPFAPRENHLPLPIEAGERVAL
jgi:uncharacterized protein